MLARSIVPYATLYLDLPHALEDRGGWRSRTCLAFADYAAAVVERLGDRWPRTPPQRAWCSAFLGYGTASMHQATETLNPCSARSPPILAHVLALPRLRSAALARNTVSSSNAPPTRAEVGDARDLEAVKSTRTPITRSSSARCVALSDRC